MWWHTRTNQISSFGLNGRVHLNLRVMGGVSSVYYWQASCAHQPRASLCSAVMWRLLVTHSILLFPLHFSSRAITFQTQSTTYCRHFVSCCRHFITQNRHFNTHSRHFVTYNHLLITLRTWSVACHREGCIKPLVPWEYTKTHYIWQSVFYPQWSLANWWLAIVQPHTVLISLSQLGFSVGVSLTPQCFSPAPVFTIYKPTSYGRCLLYSLWRMEVAAVKMLPFTFHSSTAAKHQLNTPS